MKVYEHNQEEFDSDYDNTLTPGETKNFALVIITGLLLIGTAIGIVMNMGLFKPELKK